MFETPDSAEFKHITNTHHKKMYSLFTGWMPVGLCIYLSERGVNVSMATA